MGRRRAGMTSIVASFLPGSHSLRYSIGSVKMVIMEWTRWRRQRHQRRRRRIFSCHWKEGGGWLQFLTQILSLFQRKEPTNAARHHRDGFLFYLFILFTVRLRIPEHVTAYVFLYFSHFYLYFNVKFVWCFLIKVQSEMKIFKGKKLKDCIWIFSYKISLKMRLFN